MTRRERRLEIRVNDAEYETIAAKANTAGTNISEFVRSSALRRQLPPLKSDRNAYALLGQIHGEIQTMLEGTDEKLEQMGDRQWLEWHQNAFAQILERVEAVMLSLAGTE